MMCECGEFIDPEDCVYTNIAPTEDPMIMVYAPTCEVCGRKQPDENYHLFPTNIPNRWIGGLQLWIIRPSTSTAKGDET